MKKFFSFLKSLFFPKECLDCGALGEFICSACLKKIPIRPSKPPEKIRYQDYLDQVHIASFYSNHILARLIDLYKFHYQQHLGEILAKLAIDYIKKNKLTDTLVDFIIIPLPLHQRRYLERGFNQSQILAQTIADFFNLTCINDAIIRTKYTKHQTKLNMNKRLINIAGVFSVINKQKIIGKKILLVDDVITTGASLNEAAKVLWQNGAIKVIGLVLAKN
jgi:competence protein ComFC